MTRSVYFAHNRLTVRGRGMCIFFLTETPHFKFYRFGHDQRDGYEFELKRPLTMMKGDSEDRLAASFKSFQMNRYFGC